MSKLEVLLVYMCAPVLTICVCILLFWGLTSSGTPRGTAALCSMALAGFVSGVPRAIDILRGWPRDGL